VALCPIIDAVATLIDLRTTTRSPVTAAHYAEIAGDLLCTAVITWRQQGRADGLGKPTEGVGADERDAGQVPNVEGGPSIRRRRDRYSGAPWQVVFRGPGRR
jgi:hypothetical protein